MYLKILYYYTILTSKHIEDIEESASGESGQKDPIIKAIEVAKNEFKKTKIYTFFYIKEFQEDKVIEDLSFNTEHIKKHIKAINQKKSDEEKLEYIMEKVFNIKFEKEHRLVEALKHFKKLN